MLTVATVAHAQFYRPPRSADYLFAATVEDARSLWVNPAGLGVLNEASIMGELALDRLNGTNLSVSQYTFGFNSHGFALALRHDYYSGSNGVTAFRVGAGRGVGNLALGAAFTVYRQGPDQRELTIGTRVLLATGLQLGAVIDHIFAPRVRGQRLNPEGVLGLGWTPPITGRLDLTAEVHAAERDSASGYDVRYRTGLHYRTPGRFPVGVIAALDLTNHLNVSRVVFGLSLGGLNRGIAVGSAQKVAGQTELTTLSVTGIATALQPRGRFGY
jgi:hypothetical protein